MTALNHSQVNNSSWAQKSLASYVIGFILCLALTGVSFYLVQYTPLDKTMIYIFIAIFAVLQLIVQAACFLGLKSNAEGSWNVLPFLFTLLIIFFLVGGSLWIMYNLSVLMMQPYMTL